MCLAFGSLLCCPQSVGRSVRQTVNHSAYYLRDVMAAEAKEEEKRNLVSSHVLNNGREWRTNIYIQMERESHGRELITSAVPSNPVSQPAL